MTLAFVDTGTSFYIYFGLWLVLVAAGLYVLFGSKNAKLKKAMLPALVILAGGMAFLWLVMSGVSQQMRYLLIPIIIIMIVLNLRRFKICANCASLVQGEFFSRPTRCHKCGADLNAR